MNTHPDPTLLLHDLDWQSQRARRPLDDAEHRAIAEAERRGSITRIENGDWPELGGKYSPTRWAFGRMMSRAS